MIRGRLWPIRERVLARVGKRTLTLADDAHLGETHVVDWLRQTTGRCRDQRMEWWYAVTESVPRNQREWDRGPELM
jgi:hypothetical protein